MGRPASLTPSFTPGFKHEDIPKQVLPVSPSGQMLRPVLTYYRDVKETILFQPFLGEQSLCPFSQRATQPFAEGNAKSHLGAFDKSFRNVPIKNLAQEPLTDTAANLCRLRKSPG